MLPVTFPLLGLGLELRVMTGKIVPHRILAPPRLLSSSWSPAGVAAVPVTVLVLIPSSGGAASSSPFSVATPSPDSTAVSAGDGGAAPAFSVSPAGAGDRAIPTKAQSAAPVGCLDNFWGKVIFLQLQLQHQLRVDFGVPVDFIDEEIRARDGDLAGEAIDLRVEPRFGVVKGFLPS